MEDREEEKVKAAVSAASRQAEKAYESKARELKAKGDEAQEGAQRARRAPRPRARQGGEGAGWLQEQSELHLAAMRKESREEAQAMLEAHKARLVAAQRASDAERHALVAEVASLEAALAAEGAAHAASAEAAAAQLKLAQQSPATLREADKDLRLQLQSARNAHATAAGPRRPPQEGGRGARRRARGGRRGGVKGARREAEEAKAKAAEEVGGLRTELAKAEEVVTRQLKLQAEADRTKLVSRHKSELAAAGGRRGEDFRRAAELAGADGEAAQGE